MEMNNCDCCECYADSIIPFGDKNLCEKCFKKYLSELEKAPTINKTEFNIAKRKIKQFEKNPLFMVYFKLKGKKFYKKGSDL